MNKLLTTALVFMTVIGLSGMAAADHASIDTALTAEYDMTADTLDLEIVMMDENYETFDYQIVDAEGNMQYEERDVAWDSSSSSPLDDQVTYMVSIPADMPVNEEYEVVITDMNDDTGTAHSLEGLSGNTDGITHVNEPDTTAPSISLVDFVNDENTDRDQAGVYFKEDEVTIVTSLTDSDSGIDAANSDAVVTYVDGSTETVGAEHANGDMYGFSVNASGEIDTVEVTAVDNEGNEATSTMTSDADAFYDFIANSGLELANLTVEHKYGSELTNVYAGDSIVTSFNIDTSESIKNVYMDVTYENTTEQPAISKTSDGSMYEHTLDVGEADGMPESMKVVVNSDYGSTLEKELDISHLEYSEQSVIHDKAINNTETFGDWIKDSENVSVENDSVAFNEVDAYIETIEFKTKRLGDIIVTSSVNTESSLEMTIKGYDSDGNETVSDTRTLSDGEIEVSGHSVVDNPAEPESWVIEVKATAISSESNDSEYAPEVQEIEIYGELSDSVGGIPTSPTGGFWGGIPVVGDALSSIAASVSNAIDYVLSIPAMVVEWVGGGFNA